MKARILFTERQTFKRWWIWLILLAINSLFLFGIVKQVIVGEQFGNNPMTDATLLGVTGLSVGLTILFLSTRLETKITEEGIYVRFFPFQLKFKHYPWQSLKKSYVRRYSPITEYGGWGLRLRLFGKGIAYNVSGNKGLQLEFQNRKKLLIGTNKPEELEEALMQVGQIKP